MSTSRWIDFAARGLVSVIFLQTLFFKLTYAPETQVIFQDLGGRPAATLAALAELAAVVLLWVPRKAVYGAGLSLMTIGGALMTHLLFIGIVVPSPDGSSNDGGLLFGMAVAVAITSGFLAWHHRGQLPILGPKLAALA